MQTADIGTALNEALEGLHLSLQECEAIVTHDFLPEVPGNRDQLAQVLQNLISNA